MRVLSLPPVHRLHELATLALRRGVGLAFFVHGLQKLTGGPSGFAGMLTDLGVGVPGVLARLVTIAELVGDALLLIGLLTRLATLPMIATLIGAAVLVTADVGIIAPPTQGRPGPSSTSHFWRDWWRCSCSGRAASRSTTPWALSRTGSTAATLP